MHFEHCRKQITEQNVKKMYDKFYQICENVVSCESQDGLYSDDFLLVFFCVNFTNSFKSSIDKTTFKIATCAQITLFSEMYVPSSI